MSRLNSNLKEVKASPNHSKRTFTLRTYMNGKFLNKYRTTVMSREDFEACLFNTQSDWRNFLYSDDYYVVK